MTVNKLKAKELIQLGKNNRKEATQGEIVLWSSIRNRKLGENFAVNMRLEIIFQISSVLKKD
jgi:very-short-patch-repair endonuclease